LLGWSDVVGFAPGPPWVDPPVGARQFGPSRKAKKTGEEVGRALYGNDDALVRRRLLFRRQVNLRDGVVGLEYRDKKPDRVTVWSSDGWHHDKHLKKWSKFVVKMALKFQQVAQGGGMMSVGWGISSWAQFEDVEVTIVAHNTDDNFYLKSLDP